MSDIGSTAQYFSSEQVDHNLTYPDEPMRLQDSDIDPLLLWCVSQKSSDISFQTDRPLYNDIAGILRPGTKRSLDSADMAVLLNRIYGADALARLASGTDLDLSYEIRPDRFKRVRFRVNITPILSRGRDAAQITMRVLPDEPPRMQDLNIEQDIIDHWAPRDGIVLVTGPTGSGKSTLLAAGNRMMIERANGCGKMLCYESPIEFVYDTITSENSLVAQSEIPRHLKSFDAGVRNALRRKPNIILVGEARDRETISACIEAGQTGHAVYSTVHTIGVAATIRRMVATFESGERAERAYALMETMRMIVTQILIPKEGGGRIGLREWLVFDDKLREKMLEIPPERWPAELIKIVRAQGRPMAESARLVYEQGLISDYYYKLVASSAAAADQETASTPITESAKPIIVPSDTGDA